MENMEDEPTSTIESQNDESSTEAGGEVSTPAPNGSAPLNLAARRAAPQLPKLRDIIRRNRPENSVDESLRSGATEPDLEFNYTDADSLGAELSELYSYSELEQIFVGNAVAWRQFADRKRFGHLKWRKLCVEHKRSLLLGLTEELELADRKRRIDAVRVILYLLQGSYLDCAESVSADGSSITVPRFDSSDGEASVLSSAVENVYLLVEVGVFAPLCTVLAVELKSLTEITADVAHADDSTSSVAVASQPSGTSADAVVSDQKRRRSCSLADNVDLRLILSAMYTFIEVLRRPLSELPPDYLRKRTQAERDRMESSRNSFRDGLGSVFELGGAGEGVGGGKENSGDRPLAVVLFEMVKAFCAGDSPHYPMRKTLLLLWKTLLFWLGGWTELRQMKVEKRRSCGFDDGDYFEDTVMVSKRMRAAPPPTMPPLAQHALNEGGGGGRRARPPLARRQMACSGERADGEDDVEAGIPSSADADDDDDAIQPGVNDNGNGPNAADEEEEDEVMIDLSTPTPSEETTAKEQPLRPDSPTPTSNADWSGHSGTAATATTVLLERTLPWKPKIRETDVAAFIDQERLKFFQYRLPDDATTLFGLPRPIHESANTLRRHVYVSLGERQAKRDEELNRYFFSQKETFATRTNDKGEVIEDPAEQLYASILPSIPQYMIALLKILLAAAPSSKAKTDTMNILCDVLPADAHYLSTSGSSFSLDNANAPAATTDPLEQSVLTGIDINRHKEVMVKAVSSILILLLKHFRLSHVYQFEYLAQHLVFANCIPLILKFFDQKIHQYVQPAAQPQQGSPNDLPQANYPAVAVFYATFGHLDWQPSSGSVDEASSGPPPPTLSAIRGRGLGVVPPRLNYQWRNLYSAINLLRVLNKLTKWKHARTMMLVVFKSAPILKRTLRIKQILLQLYALKLLKMQAKYLGRQWRKTNMEIMSAIYSKVRHRMNDDWAYGNETQSKPWDFQAEESALKTAVERFNVRRYYSGANRRYAQPTNAHGTNNTNSLGLASSRYYEFNDPEFERYDNDAVSLLGKHVELTDRFKMNYSKWLDREVFRANIDWDLLLKMNVGVYEDISNTTSAVTDITS